MKETAAQEIVEWLNDLAEETWKRSGYCYKNGLFDTQQSKLLQYEYGVLQSLIYKIEEKFIK